MTQIDLKTKEIPVHTVAVSYSVDRWVTLHGVSLDKTKLPHIDGAKIATDIPLYLVAYSLETVERDGDDLIVIFKKEDNGEVVFHSAHADLRNDAVLAGYNMMDASYVQSMDLKE